MKELKLTATLEALDQVTAFIEEALEEYECPMKVQMQLAIAVEELYVNIAHYAYAPAVGPAIIQVGVQEEPRRVCVVFIDQGKPYNPLAKEDPDITLSAEERSIGGLGIYMVKKSMDDVCYEYKDGSNILSIKKNF